MELPKQRNFYNKKELLEILDQYLPDDVYVEILLSESKSSETFYGICEDGKISPTIKRTWHEGTIELNYKYLV